MIKTYAHKIKHQPKNIHLFGTIIPRKQTKINNAVHSSNNPILKHEIKKQLKDLKQKKHIISIGKLVKPVNRVSRFITPNL